MLWPAVIEAVEIDSVGRSAKPRDYGQLLDNVTFKNAIAANLSFRKVMIDEYYDLKNQVQGLIRHISSELEVLE